MILSGGFAVRSGAGLGDVAEKNCFDEFDRGAVPHIALAAENGIDGL